MWKFFTDLCLKIKNKIFNTINFYLNFKLRAHEATIAVFPYVNIISCRFHKNSTVVKDSVFK
jgi:hypothetical protein